MAVVLIMVLLLARRSPPPKDLEIFFACGGGLGNLCENLPGESTEVFDATISNPDGTPASDILVTFTVDTSTTSPNESDGDTTLSPLECRTNDQGVCRTTATNPDAVEGDFVTVTAAIAGQVPATQASVILRWAAE